MRKKIFIGGSFLIIYYFFSLILVASSQYLIKIMCYTLIIMSLFGIFVIMLYKGKIIGLIIYYFLWNFVSVIISVFVSIIADQKFSSIYKAVPILFRFLLSDDLFILFILTTIVVYNIPVFLIAKNIKKW
jgi:hypothetical protein